MALIHTIRAGNNCYLFNTDEIPCLSGTSLKAESSIELDTEAAAAYGKVYTPEAAARTIVFAASHNRREMLVGFPSYKAIIGNKIAPWYADWILGNKGYDGQQTEEPADPNRKNNLWEAVHEDRGAYGDFGKIAIQKM